ncbi:DUF6924 domain-containing protein [Nocardia jiangxiensis]|nr:hypothetical protein [Nocardia jiangxiensis]
MGSVSDEVSAFAFRMWRRARGSTRWEPAARLLVWVGDDDRAVPARLSWVTRDGARSALGFTPDMASCYGHRQDGGEVQELRGELDDRPAPATFAARGYEFDTETTDLDNADAAGRLRILIDDGSAAEPGSVEWSSGSGHACSIVLLSRDVGDLVSGVRASAEHRDADEVAANLLRDSTDKWFAGQRRATLEFQLSEPIAVDHYMLTSANDAPDRDPSAWTLRGSADGRRWRILDTRSGQSFPERHHSRTYRIAEPWSCTHYRLDITGNHGSPHLQLETVRFLVDDGFVGFRHPTGHIPAPYRGTARARASSAASAATLLGGSAAAKSGGTAASTLNNATAALAGDATGSTLSRAATPFATRVLQPLSQRSEQEHTPMQVQESLPTTHGSAPSTPAQLHSAPATPAQLDSSPSTPARADAAPEIRPGESSQWQQGDSWLPLGGGLSMQSLTSPSGRFTALHSPYEPSFAVRDNHTRDRVWISDSPSSSLLCLGPDGDLVAWDHHGNHVWSTGTAWLGVQRLELRDSGELALIDADGAVVWSSGIPDVPAGYAPRPAPRGSTLRRGESLYGQSLTSDDGSTVLFHDGRVARIIVHGRTSHWDEFPGTENVLILDDDGFLYLRDLNGTVLHQISGPGTELVVERGAAELRDDTGNLVWTSCPRSQRPGPVRAPGLAQEAALTAWFSALIGDGHCIAVARDTAPQEILGQLGVTPVTGTWTDLQRHRDATYPDGGTIVAALAVDSHVLLLADDPDLPVTALAPWVATVRQQDEDCGFAAFSVHQDGELVTELREFPHRRKGIRTPEVATALTELVHDLDLRTLLFRTAGIVPDAAELGGELLGGVLSPKPEPESTSAAPLLVIDGWESMTPLVIRTDFTDDDAWNRVIEQMRSPWMDNDPVDPHPITDPRLAGAPAEQVLHEVCEALPQPATPGAIFIADEVTMREPGHPLLAVTTEWDGRPFEDDDEEFITQFRLFPDAAIEISTNLDLANMDFEDFADEGVYERMT